MKGNAMLPSFVRIGERNYEVVLIPHVRYHGREWGCRAMIRAHRLLVNAALSPFARRRALARGIRLVRRVRAASRPAAA